MAERSALAIDPKAAGGTLGATLGAATWFFLAKFGVGDIDTWTADDLVTAAGFTGVVFAAIGAYIPRNDASPKKAAKPPA